MYFSGGYYNNILTIRNKNVDLFQMFPGPEHRSCQVVRLQPLR